MKTGKDRKAKRNDPMKKDIRAAVSLWSTAILESRYQSAIDFNRLFKMHRSKHVKRRLKRGFLKARTDYAEPRGSRSNGLTATEVRIAKGMARPE